MSAKKRKPKKIVVWAVVDVKSGRVQSSVQRDRYTPAPASEARMQARRLSRIENRPYRAVRCEGVLR